MVRELKHHEKKSIPFPLKISHKTNQSRLLRKVDFHTYKSDGGHREHAIRQRYHLQDAMDYKKYNSLCGSLRQLAHKLSELDPTSDPVRKKTESELLDKLWRMGILKQSREQGAGLSRVEKEVTVSAFCRRRLAVVMVRTGMVQTVKAVCSPLPLLWVSLCLRGWLLMVMVDRRLRSWNRVMSAAGLRSLLIRLIWSPGIWRTISPGWTAARSSGISCATATIWTTLI